MLIHIRVVFGTFISTLKRIILLDIFHQVYIIYIFKMIRNRIVRSFICIKLNLNDPILIFMSIADIFRFAYSYAYTIHGLNLFKLKRFLGWHTSSATRFRYRIYFEIKMIYDSTQQHPKFILTRIDLGH